jgi:hypothetical protein
MVRRGLAVLLLADVLIIAYVAMISPLRSVLVGQSEWRHSVARDLARARGLLAIDAPLNDALKDVGRSPVASRLLNAAGANPASSLQADLTSVAASSGVTYEQTEPMTETAEGLLTRYGVRVVFSLQVDRLRRWIELVRASPHLLRVDRLQVTAPQEQGGTDNPTLHVIAEVYGFGASGPGAT